MANMCKAGVGGRVVVVVRRGPVLQKGPPGSDVFQAAASGDPAWLRLSLQRALSPGLQDRQGLTALHVAALSGRLDCMRLLLESGAADVDARCPQGRRPVHMVLTARSRPHSHACLALLMEHGAQTNVATEAGLTPLHLAAQEGLWECAVALVEAGAAVGLRDGRGHTPLDLAKVWGHRSIARFLKDRLWHEHKKRDTGRRRALQTLQQELADGHRRAEGRGKVARQKLTEEKFTEWCQKKGLPPLRAPPGASWTPAPPGCLSPARAGHDRSKKCNDHKVLPGAPREAWNISPNPNKPPRGSVARPQGVRLGSQPEESPPEPDLRHTVTLSRGADGHPQYTTTWDGRPRAAPSLPWDALQKGLFPAAYPSRIASPCHFQPHSVMDLPRLGGAPGHSASPWTEVAMHLAEELEPGRY